MLRVISMRTTAPVFLSLSFGLISPIWFFSSVLFYELSKLFLIDVLSAVEGSAIGVERTERSRSIETQLVISLCPVRRARLYCFRFILFLKPVF